MDIQIRTERREKPRSEQYLQHESMAPNPALLADTQAAIALAEADPRAVVCSVGGQVLALTRAKFVVQMLREAAERAKEDCDDYGHEDLDAAKGQCLPAKQVPL